MVGTAQCAFAHPTVSRSPAMTRRESLRRQNRPFDLAKPDAIALALAPAAHGEGIAVFEERALDATGKLDRLTAVPADLQQAATLLLFRTGDGAGAEEIADIHGAGRGSVV